MGLFVSPAAIKFTVMWLLMSVFFSLSGEDWVNRCNRGHWRGIPCEWDPCWWDPLSGDRNSLWFCTLVKVNTPPPSPASIYHSRVTIGPALQLRMGLYSEASQPDVCSSRGFFSLFLILFELSPRGMPKQAKRSAFVFIGGSQKRSLMTSEGSIAKAVLKQHH